MEFNRKKYNYSMKNIPLPSEKMYKTTLIEKVELLIKRMRWKAHLYESSQSHQSNPMHYIFKSRTCPPQHKDLIPFEEDLVKLMKSVTFKKFFNKFQEQLKTDIKSIKESNNVFVFADKTRNLYEMNKDAYDKLLIQNITKT